MQARLARLELPRMGLVGGGQQLPRLLRVAHHCADGGATGKEGLDRARPDAAGRTCDENDVIRRAGDRGTCGAAEIMHEGRPGVLREDVNRATACSANVAPRTVQALDDRDVSDGLCGEDARDLLRNVLENQGMEGRFDPFCASDRRERA